MRILRTVLAICYGEFVCKVDVSQFHFDYDWVCKTKFFENKMVWCEEEPIMTFFYCT